MYQIKCENLQDASHKIYRFLSVPSLTRPECSLWSEKGIPVMLSKDRDYTNEGTLCEKIASSGCAAVTCVASTDKKDKRRVVLNYMVKANILVLNFPFANGNPNDAETRLLKTLTG